VIKASRLSNGACNRKLQMLVHSRSKARLGSPMRALYLGYADALDLGPGLLLATA
jgi:hypothetical protein